jgi:uncharacterized protein
VHTLILLADAFAMCRLAPDAARPPWADVAGSLSIVARTPDELSILAPAPHVPLDVESSRGWRGFVVAGQLPFGTVGVMAELSGALAEAGVSLLAVSTFLTDYIFVRDADVDRARAAWQTRGHEVNLTPA